GCHVTGVQTCALPISAVATLRPPNFITTHGESGYGVSTLWSETFPCTVMTIAAGAPYEKWGQPPSRGKGTRPRAQTSIFTNATAIADPGRGSLCRGRSAAN